MNVCTDEFYSCLNFQKDWFYELDFIEKFHAMNFPFLKKEKLWIQREKNQPESQKDLLDSHMWLSYKEDLCARGND